MLDWLVVWGVGQAAWSVFRPILEDLAEDVAKDAAKSYVGQCFKNVFSVIHREPLTRATGLALKELLELIESELIRADVEDAELRGYVEDVRQFVRHDDVRQAIASLFLQPDYQLDPKTFATAWQQLEGARRCLTIFPGNTSPSGSPPRSLRSANPQANCGRRSSRWPRHRIPQRCGKGRDCRLTSTWTLTARRWSNGTATWISPAWTRPVRTTATCGCGVCLCRSRCECHQYDPQLLEVPKEHLRRLAAAGELDAQQLAETEKLHDEHRRAYVNQPPRPVLEVVGGAASGGWGRSEAKPPVSSCPRLLGAPSGRPQPPSRTKERTAGFSADHA